MSALQLMHINTLKGDSYKGNMFFLKVPQDFVFLFFFQHSKNEMIWLYL